MHYAMIAKILGLLLMLFSFVMLLPAGMAFWYHDGNLQAFIVSFAITFLCGLALWLPCMRARAELQPRDGFLAATLYWTVIGTIGCLPFLLSPHLNISVLDAIFESISGFTATGASVLSNLDSLPRSLLFWRALSNWLGGMGIILLTLAVLPMLGVGGMQFYKAEIPGPSKNAKLTPRIAETAKALWYLYVTLSVACVLSFRAAGMGWFDAICNGLPTVATAGFATHDSGFAYFNSGGINVIAAIFLLLGSTNFMLLILAWKERSLKTFWRDSEFRFFMGLEAIYVVIIFVALMFHHTYSSIWETFHQTLFQAVSFSTATGFVSASMDNWPAFIPLLLILSSFIGGCAGSTAAGMKVVRAALVFKQSGRELRRLIYPSGVFALRFSGRPVGNDVLQAVWGFMGVYLMITALSVLAIMATGVGFPESVATVAAAINNLGAGFGFLNTNFADLPDIAKCIMCLDMLLGRLEVLTILVLFTPMFWKQ